LIFITSIKNSSKSQGQTGNANGELGQIERKESSPTIATLWKIATGFDVSFSAFLEKFEADLKVDIHRYGKTQTVSPFDDKIRTMSLFPFDERLKCEIFVIELLPGCEHLSSPHKQDTVEHVIVVDGAIEVLLNGVWQPLCKGEGLRFNANQPHGYRNITSDNACFHNIIHYF
jgi:XRE family transcriptional regulator, regulator of sulfur utilization